MQRPQVADKGAASIAAKNSGRSPDADAAIAAEAANFAEAVGASPAKVVANADKAAQETAVV